MIEGPRRLFRFMNERRTSVGLFSAAGADGIFFGGSFPFFREFVDGVAPASEASTPKTVAAGSFLSAISFRFAK
jgi:hypothetical protein